MIIGLTEYSYECAYFGATTWRTIDGVGLPFFRTPARVQIYIFKPSLHGRVAYDTVFACWRSPGLNATAYQYVQHRD